MKKVMAALWFLVGLALLVGGVFPRMAMRYSLIVAGILVIVLAIVLAMKKKPEMKAPA
jgi:uncharacterized integral membrane protein